jgi:glycosyltransferase involved in cell wall biosynthesis
MGALTVALTAPAAGRDDASALLKRRVSVFAALPAVQRVVLLHEGGKPHVALSDGPSRKLHFVQTGALSAGASLARVIECSQTDDLMLILSGADVEIGPCDLERMLTIRASTGAGLVYSDYEELRDDRAVEHQTIDYQSGSLCDRFDFGGLALISKRAVERALRKYGQLRLEQRWAGAYELRLKLSVDHPIMRIPESLYTIRPGAPKAASVESLMAVNPPPGTPAPWQREYQLEMQATLTAHLRRIGAFIEPDACTPLPPPAGEFPVLASIIIPVRNRDTTIIAAVESALSQSASFSYNVIVVDHHSTDRTTAILQDLSRRHKKLRHLFPPRANLGIGGLWNTAIYSQDCGLFAVQLDSDDVYTDEHALEKLVNRFYDSDGAQGLAAAAGKAPVCALVIGHYRRVDFNLEEQPHGGTDYREWPQDNGRNDVLRLDGLGAPRAYYVPVLRRFGFPNVSYGEDYALCLRLSREYKIGRVLEPLYLARQWAGNTERTLPLSSTERFGLLDLMPNEDAAQSALFTRVSPALSKLLLTTRNRHAAYKDWLRTIEVRARMSR